MGALPKYDPSVLPPVDPPPGCAARPLPAKPVLLTRLETGSSSGFDPAPYPSRGARILPLRPSAIVRETARPVTPRISASFRDLLIMAALAVLLAISLALFLRGIVPQPASSKPAAPVAQTASQTNAIHPAKPSAYGEAFLPPQATRRGHPTAPSPASTTPATSSR